MRRIILILIFLLVLVLGAAGVFGYYMLAVTGINGIDDIQSPLTSTFYYHDGEVLATRFEQNRFEVPLESIPHHLQEAFIAVEDRRFYKHFGFDPYSLLRAVVRNVQEGRIVEGGSTISQQLARNLFLTQEKTISRKIQELLLTFQLESKFTKEELLEKYLNIIYFGHSAYGVEAAAQTYFGKSVEELSLAESAMLAGIPRGPAYYSPWLNFESAKKRQSIVLTTMVQAGYISTDEKEQALSEELILQDRSRAQSDQPRGAYFVNYLIQQELAVIFPDDPQIVFNGGLHIYTTLDRDMQAHAEEAVAQLTVLSINEKGESQPQAALVAIEPDTGAVRALVGGRDFSKNQFNRAIPPVTGQARGRSPGSAFKPFVYAAALEAGYTPATVHVSEPVSFSIPGQDEPYQPSEYGGTFYNRPLTVREALALSSNVVAVKTHMDIGPEKTVAMAKRLGIESPLQPFPSLPLGTLNVTPLEMAIAFAPFANQGYRVKPLFINKITNANGRVLFESNPERSVVLDDRIAYLITDMLKDVLQPGGTGSSFGQLLNRPAAAKTGTSDDHRDAYVVGYTPDLVASVWIGNDNNSSLGPGQTGARLAGPIWANFINKALQGEKPHDFPRPEGLIALDICPATGLVQNTKCNIEPEREIFLAGTEPTEMCQWPLCPHCPPERQWHWDGWWFRIR